MGMIRSRAQTLPRPRACWLVVMWRNLAIQDWICVGFHAFMYARVTVAPDSADASIARAFSGALLVVTLTGIALGRGELLPKGWLRSLAYRVLIFAPVVLSYFELRELLAAVSPVLYDTQLEAIDRALFGTPPAVWLQRFNQYAIIEWFSFFYYSYFFLLTIVLVPSLLFDRGRRLRELMVGSVTIVAVGHISYTLVPALGPVVAYPFDEPTNGGFFFGIVEHAVCHAGALMDVFPSLHTAMPVYLTLFLFGNRRRAPHKYAWPVLGFFAANIIVATLLLRWHWGIDIVCGIMLAIAARALSVYVARWEAGRSVIDDRQPTWEPLGLRLWILRLLRRARVGARA